MSNLHVGVRDRPDASVHPVLQSLPAPPAHVSLADRLSLRVGLWLLLRSSEHAQHRADHATQSRLVRNAREREARELAYERERLLWPSR